MNTATIFVHSDKNLAGEPCVGVRFDTQILPHGCYVAGFITGKIMGAAIEEPYLSTKNHMLFVQAEKYARAVLAAAYSENPMPDEPEWLI